MGGWRRGLFPRFRTFFSSVAVLCGALYVEYAKAVDIQKAAGTFELQTRTKLCLKAFPSSTAVLEATPEALKISGWMELPLKSSTTTYIGGFSSTTVLNRDKMLERCDSVYHGFG